MERKEVFVEGETKDLNLERLNSAISNGGSEGRKMQLEVGTTVFQAGRMRGEGIFALHWTGMTSLRNVVWQRFVLLSFRRPFVQTLSFFMNVEEDI